jgi:hypothetical protein
VNTIETTHSALKTRAQNTFHLSDQELLIRQLPDVGFHIAANVLRPSAVCRRLGAAGSGATLIDDLPDDATTLLHLLYSMILVSYAVNVFKQNRIPDSGAAFFEMVAEPAV